MNKNYTILLFYFLIINLAVAQNERYDFASSNEPYVNLTQGEPVFFNPNDDWADFDQLLELDADFGFTVNILGLDGEEMFNFLTPALLVSTFDDEADDPVLPFLLPTTTQLQNRGVIPGNAPSQITFQTIGDPGSQIFKLEYRDVGFANESFLDDPSQDMFTNFQIWIYEGSGCIEYRYGETNITDPDLIYDGDNGSSSGLFRSLSSQLDGDTVLYAIYTTGDAQNPTVFEGENTAEEAGNEAIGFPGEGVVYSFCPEIEVNTTDLNTELDWEVYPNPTSDILTIKLNEINSAEFRLLSMNGQTVRTGIINDQDQKIDVSDLSKGIYMLFLLTDEGIATKRFWKQ